MNFRNFSNNVWLPLDDKVIKLYHYFVFSDVDPFIENID